MKTRKSITKRFKITKNGKILRRATGQDHSRAKKSGSQIRKTRKWVLVDKTLARQLRKAIVI